MMVSTSNMSLPGLSRSSVAGLPGDSKAELTPTQASPLGSVLLSRESPNPPTKCRPLHLPLSYYVRIAAEHRLLKQALAGIRMKQHR